MQCGAAPTSADRPSTGYRFANYCDRRLTISKFCSTFQRKLEYLSYLLASFRSNFFAAAE